MNPFSFKSGFFGGFAFASIFLLNITISDAILGDMIWGAILSLAGVCYANRDLIDWRNL